MNVEDLSVAQRRALAIFAFQMMVVDHSAAPREQQRVDWLERELGVQGAISPSEYLVEPSLDLFPDARSRLLLLAELYVVAVADGYRHPDEHALLKRLAASFELSRKTLDDLAAWASQPAESRPPALQAVALA